MISPDMHYIDCKPHQEKYYNVTDGEHSGVIDYNTGKVLISLDRGYTYTRYNPAYNYIQVKRETSLEPVSKTARNSSH